ncbi:hypothetical protein GGR34_003677 [Microvirga flocculans]|uniref:Uncharacterized protein n=1 Tax=Microvirga flocculans TaxID=217168 RepID=A0A7W6IIA3_9HYPH|nr:hypothetical protein [Microvirga flocculans]MBB4041992.1 hypothetical protein [Microvirga flocculans]
MALGGTIEWQEVTLLITIMGGLATPIIWTWRDNRAGVQAAHRRIDDLRTEIAAYKLEAAKTFVTTEAIARIESRLIATEERMVASMEKISDRLDRAIEARAGRMV